MDKKSIGVFSTTLSIYMLNSCSVENNGHKELLSKETVTNYNHLSNVARNSSDKKIKLKDVRELEHGKKP